MVAYQTYPKGTPQLYVLNITVVPNTSLPWHEHPIPNAAYVLKGALTVEKKANGEKRMLKAGDVVSERVDSAHRSYTGKEGVTLVVFYAGQKGSLYRNRPDNCAAIGVFSLRACSISALSIKRVIETLRLHRMR